MNDDTQLSEVKESGSYSRRKTDDEINRATSALKMSTDPKAGNASSLKSNFWLFCIFYSVIHGAVDAVLAFSAAELGTNLGSLGGTVLYVFYTCSALLIAKPCLQYFESKNTVFLGLVGLLIYVLGFFLAILVPSAAPILFLSGCAIGGIGAGFLWTGQGSYYTLNATYYALAANSSRPEAITNFAGIFAGAYLSFETVYKFLGTFVFVVVGIASSSAWQPILFGIYTATALISTIFFWAKVQPLKDHPSLHMQSYEVVHTDDSVPENEAQRKGLLSKTDDAEPLATPTKGSLTFRTKKQSHSYLDTPDTNKVTSATILSDVLAVGHLMFSVRKLQLLIPYQICFGLSAGLVDTYVNGVIVKNYIGDGYIGILSGLVTLSAALLAAPFAIVGNSREGRGKDWIMIGGGLCFAVGGLMLLVLTDAQIARWPVIIAYYIFHGAARGVWENTNKAVVSEMFESSPSVRDAAFATVYFSSGLAGALGFAFFQFLNKSTIALINLAISSAAVGCFLLARKLHRRDMRMKEVRQMVSALDDSDHLSDASDDNDEVSIYFSPEKETSRLRLSSNPMHDDSHAQV